MENELPRFDQLAITELAINTDDELFSDTELFFFGFEIELLQSDLKLMLKRVQRLQNAWIRYKETLKKYDVK